MTPQKEIMLAWIARDGGATDPLWETEFKRAPQLALPPFVTSADLHAAELDDAIDAGTVRPTEEFEDMGRAYEAALGMVEEAVKKLKAMAVNPDVCDADSIERETYRVIAFLADRIEWLDGHADPRCDSERGDLPGFVDEDYSTYREET